MATHDEKVADPKSPVRADLVEASASGSLINGIALCLSGGGYRAMLFHAGALWRLNEAGILKNVSQVSSVSGGSITAGVLAMNWSDLQKDGFAPAAFENRVIKTVREIADTTIDLWAIAFGLLLPFVTISGRVASSFDRWFRGKTFQDLPAEGAGVPRFTFNATNVQTGSLWRFCSKYMADWQVGEWDHPNVRLALAVAASSAFPPVLSPCILRNDRPPDRAGALTDPRYWRRVLLSDGGVYDNLGLETAFKRYTTVLVSDGGQKTPCKPRPWSDWASIGKRVVELIDNQVRSLRVRQLIDAYQATDSHHRSGAYWGIRTSLADYKVPDPFGYIDPSGAGGAGAGAAAANLPAWKKTADLAAISTRLARLDDMHQKALINWGYVVCDAALRAYAKDDLKALYQIDIDTDTTRARSLPYPAM